MYYVSLPKKLVAVRCFFSPMRMFHLNLFLLFKKGIQASSISTVPIKVSVALLPIPCDKSGYYKNNVQSLKRCFSPGNKISAQ